MPGVRIRHKSLASCVLVIRDKSRPLPRAPYPYVFPTCSTCNIPHAHKTYHLNLDDSGSVIVSETILERLKALADMGGFAIENEVKKPPSQHLIIPRADQKVKAFTPSGGVVHEN